MSLADLQTKLDEYPWGYLVTVSDQQRAHSLAVPTQYVDGVLAMSAGSTETSKSSIGGSANQYFGTVGGGSSGASAAGAYLIGISIQAIHKGEIIATYSSGQNLRKGEIISPVLFAREAAEHIAKSLIRKREIGRK